MYKKIITISIIFSLFICCSERLSNYYKSFETANKDGAIKRGWIPEFIPKSSTEIYEQHDLDTNERWIRFNLSEIERNNLLFDFVKLTHEDILKIKIRYPSRVNWWFKDIVQQSPANDAALNAEIYKKKGKNKFDNFYLADDRCSLKIYLWSYSE